MYYNAGGWLVKRLAHLPNNTPCDIELMLGDVLYLHLTYYSVPNARRFRLHKAASLTLEGLFGVAHGNRIRAMWI